MVATKANRYKEIADATPVEIQINDYQEGVNMFDPRAKNCIYRINWILQNRRFCKNRT